MGLLEQLAAFKGNLRAVRQNAYEAGLNRPGEGDQQPLSSALARQLARSGLGPDNPQAATAVGLMMDPASRALGNEMAANLLGSQPAEMTPYQQAQVSRWQEQSLEAAQRMELQRQGLQMRQMELQAGMGFRQQTVAQAWERLGQQYRPTPQQGSVLAGAEYGIDSLQKLISAARPEYFGFVSDNYGEAVKEVRNRLGTDEEFSAFWNLLDNYKIEINSGRFAGVLSDQDVRLLNSAWPGRSTDPDVAFRFLGNMLSIMQSKRDVAENAIRYSGRNPPGTVPDVPARPDLGQFVRP